MVYLLIIKYLNFNNKNISFQNEAEEDSEKGEKAEEDFEKVVEKAVVLKTTCIIFGFGFLIVK